MKLNTFTCHSCSKAWTDHEESDPGPEFCVCGQLVAPDHHRNDPEPNPEPEDIPELNGFFMDGLKAHNRRMK